MLGASLLSLVSTQKIVVIVATMNTPDLVVLKELAEAKKLTVALDRRYQLGAAIDALKELEKGHARGKSVVVMEHV
jgi:D-arabinose 1-dehydrogenase-like Zn-dependent alcohol dehydrogenase